MSNLPVIPENITVHLGVSSDSAAENVTVSFPDYIKNVASSEIFPTWPDTALRANIYAIISFAMNRVYTEFYRSQGYPFDITSTSAEDQTFIRGREVFENISAIVDGIFNNYIVRQGFVEPLFAVYCNGTTSTCNGLSQWGTVELSGRGFNSYATLQNYYGDDIDIVFDAPVAELEPSDPDVPLRLGSIGDDVRFVQLRLNRISKNYPYIPKISPVSGVFTEATENAVKKFQEVFNLTVDGIVGKATWYKIQFIYNGVKRLNDIAAEGLLPEEVESVLPEFLRPGDEGDLVRVLQYFLSVISLYYAQIPSPEVNGVYDEATLNAVTAFQKLFGLTADGITGERTWYALLDTYVGIIESLDGQSINGKDPFPGEFLALGSTGDDVRDLQFYLGTVASVYPSIIPPAVTGVFDSATEEAVKEFQGLFDFNRSGIVGPVLWDELTDQYLLISEGNIASEGQFKGEQSRDKEGI